MAAFNYVYCAVQLHFWPAIVVFESNMRKRAIEVQLRYQRRIALKPVYAAQQSFPYFRK